MWNSGYYGGLSFTEQAVLGAQVKATPRDCWLPEAVSPG